VIASRARWLWPAVQVAILACGGQKTSVGTDAPEAGTCPGCHSGTVDVTAGTGGAPGTGGTPAGTGGENVAPPGGSGGMPATDGGTDASVEVDGSLGAGGDGATGGVGGASTGGAAGSGSGGTPPSPPPLPPAVVCGSEQCDVTAGQVCCWDRAADEYLCAADCPAGTTTLACDDDGDCVEGHCKWFETIIPYSACSNSVDGRPLACSSNDHCGQGSVCCVRSYLQTTALADGEKTVDWAFYSSQCTQESHCPLFVRVAPACASDADCPEPRECAGHIANTPPSIQSCSALADSVTDAPSVDCGEEQCFLELGSYCKGTRPLPPWELPCGYYSSEREEPSKDQLWCDEHADCAPDEQCLLSYGVQPSYNAPTHSAACSTDIPVPGPWAPGPYPIQCKSSADCADGQVCCVREAGSSLDTIGVMEISCRAPGQCTSPIGRKGMPERCQVDADCSGQTDGRCMETRMSGVSLCTTSP
jgi:hypothetical protein